MNNDRSRSARFASEEDEIPDLTRLDSSQLVRQDEPSSVAPPLPPSPPPEPMLPKTKITFEDGFRYFDGGFVFCMDETGKVKISPPQGNKTLGDVFNAAQWMQKIASGAYNSFYALDGTQELGVALVTGCELMARTVHISHHSRYQPHTPFTSCTHTIGRHQRAWVSFTGSTPSDYAGNPTGCFALPKTLMGAGLGVTLSSVLREKDTFLENVYKSGCARLDHFCTHLPVPLFPSFALFALFAFRLVRARFGMFRLLRRLRASWHAHKPSDPVDKMGLRATETQLLFKDSDYDNKYTNMWEEMWATLYAASVGLHPRVYLCGKMTSLTGTSSAYVMARYSSLNMELKEEDELEREKMDSDPGEPSGGLGAWGARHSVDLHRLVVDLSNMGFIHTDIKPSNIVMVPNDDRASVVRRFMIIDMGGDFVRLDTSETIDRDCILLINTLLLTITTYCESKASNNGVTLSTHLRAQLGRLHAKFTEAFESLPKRTGKEDKWFLCHMLREINVEVLSDIKRIDKRVGGKDTSFFRTENYEMLSEHILAMADHYAKLRPRKDKSKCALNEDWATIFKDAKEEEPWKSVYETLVETIDARITLNGGAGVADPNKTASQRV